MNGALARLAAAEKLPSGHPDAWPLAAAAIEDAQDVAVRRRARLGPFDSGTLGAQRAHARAPRSGSR